ncbi:hypothetical protein [Clostridium rectalis]|nr:hypothetical protein [Clostridium rectalis]
MFQFLKDMRQTGKVTNEMLDLYLDVFINQEEYEKLKGINP